MIRTLAFLFGVIFCTFPTNAEDGSRLWLRMNENGQTAQVTQNDSSPTLDIAAGELRRYWRGVPITLKLERNKNLKPDGFCIRHTNDGLTLSSPGETGLLYAVYHLLRQQACGVPPNDTTINPTYNLRILNHWDNPDGTIERGYAGNSLWQWNELPEKCSPRYQAYARANASIGINGSVLNNVNASPSILSTEYLQKVKAIADVFRPYGIRVFLSVNFASPMVLDNLPTADPKDKAVIQWWKQKAKEIYKLIPDFGGFLVKANSEGQPGPCDYGRTHAEGANLLAEALKPYGGIVMWRAFVYSPNDADRAKQAYQEFKPLDGEFQPNVIVQVKNGPIDFQPREPYSPLFGSMPHTPLMVEFQITQEYLGQANHLAYLAPMWKEFFSFVPPTTIKAIAGVSNIGTATNWCGHPFAAANWYAFGRLAWNPELSAEQIAEEWLAQTFSTRNEELKQMMLDSREALVNYMMPLGLHHIFAWGHHYGPEPWCQIDGARPDWLPSYYHKADQYGIGFDRTTTGSSALAQYPDSLARIYANPTTCPEQYLLYFHHLPWTYHMANGHTLWEELCYHYDKGVQQVRDFQKTWDKIEPFIDPERFKKVQSLLKTQVRDAIWWKDACLLYFQEFSGMPIPYDIERPIHDLDALKQIQLPITNYECPSPTLLNQNR